jgi:hypothetical protein
LERTNFNFNQFSFTFCYFLVTPTLISSYSLSLIFFSDTVGRGGFNTRQVQTNIRTWISKLIKNTYNLSFRLNLLYIKYIRVPRFVKKTNLLYKLEITIVYENYVYIFFESQACPSVLELLGFDLSSTGYQSIYYLDCMHIHVFNWLDSDPSCLSSSSSSSSLQIHNEQFSIDSWKHSNTSVCKDVFRSTKKKVFNWHGNIWDEISRVLKHLYWY